MAMILHRDGLPRRSALAILAIALASLVAAAPAHAETVGGSQLDSSRRTVNLSPEAQPLPEVWAATWVLADAVTGEILAHKGAHVQRPPASTLKTLTALTVLPQTSRDQTYVATRRAASIYGSRVGLKPGKTYTMHQLWNAVFLPSANDAAIAVAEVNGGVRKTVEEMNEVAAGLGALDTVAKNTNGLDAPGQVSSAYDLALIARAGLEREDFSSYARRARAQFPDVRGRGTHTIYTTNRMLLNGWPGAIGVKTGFTSRAGRTFVGAAERNGRTLIVALMGIKESTDEAAKKLLTWGFRNADKVEPVGVLVEPGAVTQVRSSIEESPAPSTGSASEAADLTVDATDGSSQTAASLAPGESTSASIAPTGLIGVAIAVAVVGGVFLLRRGRLRR
jgi:D-alanyl-D-alanine carboxypeptidase (penicillin-binding protein 5/6)